MHTLQIQKQVDEDGHLRLDIPLLGNQKRVNVVLMIDSITSDSGYKYNCSDLVGKLGWRGNAVADQRKMRDEWER